MILQLEPSSVGGAVRYGFSGWLAALQLVCSTEEVGVTMPCRARAGEVLSQRAIYMSGP